MHRRIYDHLKNKPRLINKKVLCSQLMVLNYNVMGASLFIFVSVEPKCFKTSV